MQWQSNKESNANSNLQWFSYSPTPLFIAINPWWVVLPVLPLSLNMAESHAALVTSSCREHYWGEESGAGAWRLETPISRRSRRHIIAIIRGHGGGARSSPAASFSPRKEERRKWISDKITFTNARYLRSTDYQGVSLSENTGYIQSQYSSKDQCCS